MDENDKPDGSTAMERLAREMAECVAMFSPNAWCYNHGVSVMGNYDECVKAARADILRRISEARDEDLFKDDYMVRGLKRMTGMHLDKDRCTTCGDVDEMVVAVEGWKAKAAELDALCLEIGTDDGDEALMVARELLEEHYELKELREAGRIMPEGVSWPRYEDGEPVRMGEPFVAWDGQESKVRFVTLYAPGQDAAWSINAGSCHNLFGGRDAEHQMHGLRIKSQDPKAVGADGREVKPGDTVWLAPKHREMAWSIGPSHNLNYVSESEEMTVSRVKNGRDCVVAWMEGEENRWCPASWLTHERHDSWERLREDARKYYAEYWGCIDFCCDKCPALVDGKSPNERYGKDGCYTAEKLDLVARAERLAGVQGE